ncbi:MAG: aminotransferase class I/II-fold pyridoxal phosphate-dependent enzyme [Chloroflexi bacterium]|nr:aminotransferase class I/II-fold pyridoxal phosphate-dependent enzyme [Chloroflexota bacterium]
MTPVYDLKTGYPDINLVPRQRISEITAEIMRSGRGWQYGGDLQGTLATREPLARFISQASGVPVTPDEVMITGGALTAIDILCRALTQPGDVVVVEDPTFYFVAQVIRMSHVEVVSVPLNADGIDLNALASLCDRYGERLKVVYAIPSFQNPTGITATNRAALAALAQQRNFYVIEDSTYQLLYFDAPPPPYLKTYDQSGHVMNVGSMSKLLMPALRSGWIWAQPQQIAEFKKFKDDAGSTLTAEIVADFIRLGELPGQVEHARQLYAGRHNAMVAALDRYAPDWLDWSAPNGGFFVWATLPEGMTATRVEPLAAARDVAFMPGRNCYIKPPDDRHLRLCFAKMEDDVLVEGIARLSAALNEARRQI